MITFGFKISKFLYLQFRLPVRVRISCIFMEKSLLPQQKSTNCKQQQQKNSTQEVIHSAQVLYPTTPVFNIQILENEKSTSICLQKGHVI